MHTIFVSVSVFRWMTWTKRCDSYSCTYARVDRVSLPFYLVHVSSVVIYCDRVYANRILSFLPSYCSSSGLV